MSLGLTQIGYIVLVGWYFFASEAGKNTNQREQYRSAEG